MRNLRAIVGLVAQRETLVKFLSGGQKKRVSIAIPRPINPKSTKMLVQLPVNVSFRGNVVLQADKADPGIATPFARCVASGCVAEFDLKEDAVKKLRNAAGAGSITFKNSNEQDVIVPLSLKGLGPALDALAKE